MSKVSRDALKPKFYTGSIPGGSDFTNLIDSVLDLCASGQPALHSVASLQAGTGVVLTQAGSTINIAVLGGVSISASGQPVLVNAASLRAGTGIVISQVGSVIQLSTTTVDFTLSASGQLTITGAASLQTAPCGFLALTQTGSVIQFDTTASNARRLIEMGIF